MSTARSPLEALSEAERARIRRSGWIDAVLFCVAIAAISIAYAVAIRHGAHVVVFVLYSMLLSAGAPMAFTGRRADTGAIFRAGTTWVVGLCTLTIEVFYFLMLADLAPADGSLLIRISIPLALVAGLLVKGRSHPPGVWIGAVVVTAGVLPIIVDHLQLGHMLGVVFGLVTAASFVLRGFASEVHPANRPTDTISERLSVSARILLVTAGACLVLVAALMLAVAGGLVRPTPLIPAPTDLMHLPTLMLALLVGAVILTSMNYLAFSSVAKIGTSNFIATSAFMPVTTLLAQIAAEAAGLIVVPPLEWRLVAAMGVVVAGVLVILASQRRQTAR